MKSLKINLFLLTALHILISSPISEEYALDISEKFFYSKNDRENW